VAAECIRIGCEVLQLHNQFNQDYPSFNKGQTLLDYLHTLEVAATDASKTVKQLVFRNTSGRVVCSICWAVAAGFTVKDSNGVPSQVLNPQFKKMMAKVRRSVTDASAAQNNAKVPTKPKSVVVLAFLKRYMEHSTDRVPSMHSDEESDGPEKVSRQRVHLDVARKIELYAEFEKHQTKLHLIDHSLPATVSSSYFLKTLRENYRVIQHKHNNFSQCYLCFLFRELKSRATTEADKKYIQQHREAHYRIVYLERVEYHSIRVSATLEPESYISLIVDAMTKHKTAGPTLTRHVSVSNFRPLEQQLYGVLVHGSPNNDEYAGGFFGYMVDESVVQGTNFNVECVHRTLLKLADTERGLRKTWPHTLFVQLDNTSKDNKNRGTFGYFAYLVAAGTFKKVVVSFLPVGHTHEDIDAVFGVIMRHLHRHRCLTTMQKLMDAIWDAFFGYKSKSSWQPSAELEHIKGTHDWNRWLKKACEESTHTEPALNDLSNFALLVGEKACADSRRPHRFEFNMAGSGPDQHVVLNYFRWCHDREAWGQVPILVFPLSLSRTHSLMSTSLTAEPLSHC
jgi:hypothetical protein